MGERPRPTRLLAPFEVTLPERTQTTSVIFIRKWYLSNKRREASGLRSSALQWQGIEYSLRENHRAKRVILKVGANGLEVIVPRRFGKRRLPEILEANRDWIEKELKRVKEIPSVVPPECINLIAIGERWQVSYQSPNTADGQFSVKWDALGGLLVEGDVDDIRGVSSVLTQWLHLKAHAHLVPWLRECSREFQIPFQKATVRGQSTRWASCAKSGTISINRKLLFLPEHLVRHVFLHELCHIRAFNHSPEFWAFLQHLEPNSFQSILFGTCFCTNSTASAISERSTTHPRILGISPTFGTQLQAPGS